MNLFKLLSRRSKYFYLILSVLSLISSITSLGILFIVNTVIAGKTPIFLGLSGYSVFLFSIVVSFVSTIFFQNYMAELTNNIMFDLEIDILQKIRNASFNSFEKLGKEKLYAIISDVSVIGRVPEVLIIFINSSMTVSCSLLYLFYISPVAGLTIFLFILILLAVFLFRNKKVAVYLNEVRNIQDSYFVYLRELIDGFKQIKLSQKRNNNLFNNYLLANRKKAKDLNIKASRKYIVNQLFGAYSWYILLGIIIFLLPAFFDLRTRRGRNFYYNHIVYYGARLYIG
ncbi:ABC transporter transmembrane domain-containing protein [Mucilaginibacter sp. P25]|uniref:ABC transporter transmembrane domain-containing protein n=1 Tax=Mucilaginibacter sp. P25 TaxID=3423945 RepID=UPI003D7A382F